MSNRKFTELRNFSFVYRSKWTCISLSILLSVMYACIDPLGLSTEREVRILVVEGAISTLPGPYQVRLTESVKYGSATDGVVEGVLNAEVSIRDDTGLVIPLQETENGRYETPPTFQAEVGRAYSLLIEKTDGKCYLSAPEFISAVPDIDSLTYERGTVFTRNGGGQIIEKNVIGVSAHFKDPADAKNYYLWRTQGTYKIDTNPELFNNSNPDIPPMPKECCATCWITEVNETVFRLERDQFSNGSSITKEVIEIEDNGLYFQDKYLLRVLQSSISREAYDFFSLMQNQMSIEGDLFDPPPATIRGNMFSIDEPDEPVIGFFVASDAKIDSIFLLRSYLDIPQMDAFIPDDCRLVRSKSHTTTIAPPYW